MRDYGTQARMRIMVGNLRTKSIPMCAGRYSVYPTRLHDALYGGSTAKHAMI